MESSEEITNSAEETRTRVEDVTTTRKENPSEAPPPLPPVQKLDGYKPCEMVLFKMRARSPCYTAESGVTMTDNDCTTEQCNCKEEAVRENIRSFCNALLTVAHCRRHMCPYTLETVLTHEFFGVGFEWIEYGDFLDGIGDDEDNCPVGAEKVSTGFVDDASEKNTTTSISETARPASPANDLSKSSTASSSQSLLNGTDTSFSKVTTGPEKQGKTAASMSALLVLNSAIMEPLPRAPCLQGITQTFTERTLSSETQEIVSPPAENESNVQPDEPGLNNNTSNSSMETHGESPSEQATGRELEPGVSTTGPCNQVEKTPVSSSTQPTFLHCQVPVIPSSPLEKIIENSNQQVSLSNQENSTLLENSLPINHVHLPPPVCDSGVLPAIRKEKITDSNIPQRRISTPKTPEALPQVDLFAKDIEATILSATAPSVPSNPTECSSANSSRLVMDTSFESASTCSTAVEAEKECDQVSESTTANQSSKSTTEEISLENISLTAAVSAVTCNLSSSNKRPISLGTESSSSSTVTQSPNKRKPILETVEGLTVYTVDSNVNTLEGNIESQKSIFGPADAARVREILGRRPIAPAIVSSIFPPVASEPSQSVACEEAMEDGETGESRSVSVEGSEVDTNVSEKSLSLCESEFNSSKAETTKTASTLLQEEGVKTRSKSSRPAPASVKRQRVSRTAKENAQAKISSTFVSGTIKSSEESLKQNPAKDGEATSDSVRFQESTTPLPAVDEPNEQFQSERSERATTTPVTVQGTKENSKTSSTTEENKDVSKTASVQTITETISSSDSDSEESQCSTVSEIPLQTRLDRKRKRKEKEHMKAIRSVVVPQKSTMKLPVLEYDSDTSSRHSIIAHKTRSKLQKLKSKSTSGIAPNSMKGKSVMETGRIWLRNKQRGKRLREKKESKETESSKTNSLVELEDDDIQIVEGPTTSMLPPAAGKIKMKETSTLSQDNNAKTMHAASQNATREDNIHITFNKDKTKSILQRSNSSPVKDSPTLKKSSSSLVSSNANNNNISDPRKIAKSTSLPPTSSAAATVTEQEVVLEDSPSWVFESGMCPTNTLPLNVNLRHVSLTPSTKSGDSSKQAEKTQQNTLTSAASESERKRHVSSSDSPSAETFKKPSASSKDDDSAAESPLRSVRMRKQIFDPKMEAIKISPKPVPTVRKETLQQKQSSTSSPTTSSNPKDKEKGKDQQQSTGESAASVGASNIEKTVPSKCVPPERSSQNSTKQNKTDDDDIRILTPPNTSITGVLGSLDSQKQQSDASQSSSQKSKSQPEKMTPLTPQRDDREKSPTLVPQQPQLQKQAQNQKAADSVHNSTKSVQKTNPQNSNLVLVGGEIRAVPKPSTNSTSNSSPDESAAKGSVSSTGSSASSLSSRGGTWRRGSSSDVRRQPVIAEDTIDFETPPDNLEARRNNGNAVSRNRPVGQRGGFRGGANHHHRGGNHQGGSYRSDYQSHHPPQHEGPFFNGPPRGTRARPFRGGGGPPSRANQKNTQTSHGRYNQQQQRHHENQFPGRVDDIQFPDRVDLRDIQFNSQFIPQFSVHDDRVPRVNFSQMNQGPLLQTPYYDFDSPYPPPRQQSFQPPHFY